MTMAAPDIDAQVMEIGSAVGRRLDEIAEEVASSVRANVEFYKDTRVVSADELLSSSTENIRFLFDGLSAGAGFDTSPAETTGTNRAAAGVPLPVVMDAFRVASHHLWDAMIEVAGEHPAIGRAALLRATALLWQAQDVYTDAMTAAYRRQAMHQALEDETERSALTEALLQARITDDRSLWEVAQLLRLPQKGPYVVIAAQCPSVGKQALPGIHAMLRSIDVFSAWRLLPDLQIGIAHIPSDAERGALLELLGRVATTPVGVSPAFDDLADTAQALRYARVAVNARGRGPGAVTVFDDSVIAVAAVSAPEVSKKVAELVLGGPSTTWQVRKRTFCSTRSGHGWTTTGRSRTRLLSFTAIPTRCATGCTASRNAPGVHCLCRVSSPSSAWPSRSTKTVGSAQPTPRSVSDHCEIVASAVSTDTRI